VCRRKIHSQTNVYPRPSPFSEGVQVCRCAGVQAKDSLSDKRLPSALAFLRRCAGVQVCRRKIYSQTNKYKGRPGVQVSRSRRKDSLSDKQTRLFLGPRLSRKACRCAGVRRPWQMACSSLPRVGSRLSLIRQLEDQTFGFSLSTSVALANPQRIPCHDLSSSV